ncbi:MAG: hypothetical protein IJ189_12965 [Clostridia bacterium]|nr:hypothetical protein [Clostridia bacterium]
MIAKSQVIVALRPWLGDGLSQAMDGPMDCITQWLNAWSPRQDLGELADQIDSLLFRSVREATRGHMLIQLEDGSWVRIRVEDFAAMADDVMEPLLNSFPVDADHLLLLRSFSMNHPSLSALKALSTRFAPLQTAEELAAIASVVKSCYPAFRWRAWLDG